MSYKVLYRKYRPSLFKEVVGQEATVKILKNSIINNKISHAYLFAGPRGTGKTSMARIFARTINCTNPKDGEACGECDNCSNFNSSSDIIEIDAASNNGVDEIRELINNVKIMPNFSKYKVYIIDEVHMLSPSAFNALLLTLEEPPSHVIFILATTNIENVPITIQSRCQKYEFYRINNDLITNHLEEICQKEKIDYDKEGLNEITTLADGGLRDALSMLDQLSKTKEKITLNLVIKELGSISLVKINELVENIDLGKIDKAITIIDELKKSNLNYKIVIKKIIEILSSKAVEIIKNGQKNKLSYYQIKQIIFELNDCLNKINININPYILIQLVLLNNYDEQLEEKKEKVVIESSPIKTIEKEEVKPEQNEIKEESSNKTNDILYLKKVRINNCFVGVNKETLNKIKEYWPTFLQNIKGSLKGLMSDTQPVAASNEYVIITTSIPHQDMEINEKINEIEKNLKEYNQNDKKIIALYIKDWEEEREKYIKNLRTNHKYEYMSEIKNNGNDLEKIANNIFAKEKIEIR